MNNGHTQTNAQALLRALPAVDSLLSLPAGVDLVSAYGRPLVVEALRAVLEARRRAILAGDEREPMQALLLADAGDWLADLVTPTLQPVINGTGVIVHTNLGRAPLSAAAMAAVQAAAAGYSNLEYDLPAGQRGSRTVHAAALLTRLTGAEAALVVNNNAAAVLLMLTALCAGREVLISRGQLVEIGGGFRVPDVMAQSGARLVEVGTTNRTHLRDYRQAINENTGAILVAHHSNFKIVGFTSEPPLADLAQLAQEHDLPLLYDQGSGALLDTGRYGLAAEPTVGDGLAAGVDVIAFSGDKLLGGPQAGILAGRADLMSRIKGHPLARAVRADKLCLAGLSATLTHYVKNEAVRQIPVWQMIARPAEDLATIAADWAAHCVRAGLLAGTIPGESTVGGGSLPGTTLLTTLLALDHPDVEEVAARLRAADLPVIARIAGGQLLIDPRTVRPGQEDDLLAALVRWLTPAPPAAGKISA
jgi:L-seryl-tRNA(Ser) seleniumtransferase